MTWYYMPSTCAADTEASSLPCDTLGSTPEPWLTLSGTATQRPLSWRGWRNRRLLSGLTCSPSTLARGATAWISSLRVSLASLSAPPVSGWVLTTTATSGRGSQTSSATFDPDTSCWRTSGELFEQCYPMSSLTLPDSGSMRNGECSPRPPLVHPIDANAGGAWPTPTGTDSKASGNGAKAIADGWAGTLADVGVRMWPTPRASEGSSGSSAMSRADFRPTLKQSVAMWPTPRASEGFRGTDPPHGDGGPSLRQVATSGPHDQTTETAGTGGKVLNPRFIEALMGLPNGWLTPSTSAETDSSRNAPPKPYDNSPTGRV